MLVVRTTTNQKFEKNLLTFQKFGVFAVIIPNILETIRKLFWNQLESHMDGAEINFICRP